MTGFVLDTNVVSELTKDRPEPRVLAFLNRTADTWLSSVVVHEIRFGMHTMPAGRRRDQVRADLSALLASHSDRILPLDRAGAEWAAHARAKMIRAGHDPGLADLLIAGTAAAHNLAVATRNVRDFEGLGIEVVNPWTIDLQDRP
ncbi:MAG: type II toxin-antitoxin system VapC family toxin [bacterium]|nr:type II toxin-antitoxin system VapC family toxin [bacterium]